MSPADKAPRRLLHRPPFPAGAGVCIINSLSKEKGLVLGHSNADSLPNHKPHVAYSHASTDYTTDATKKKKRKKNPKKTNKKIIESSFSFSLIYKKINK